MLIEYTFWINPNHSHQLVLSDAVLVPHRHQRLLDNAVEFVDVDIFFVVFIFNNFLKFCILILLGIEWKETDGFLFSYKTNLA